MRLAEIGAHDVACRGDRLLGHARAVGTHVRDETDGAVRLTYVDALVQILREPHGALAVEPELLRRFLLQRARRERRRRILAALAPLDLGDREFLVVLDVGEDAVRFVGVVDLRLLAVDLVQLRDERLRALLQVGGHRPVLDRLERANLALALHDDAQRDRLHASGRQPLLDRLP